MNALIFVVNSILLGIGLAMDAFCVSMVNSLQEPDMRAGKAAAVAGTYAGFQFLMPVIGWIFVHTLMDLFTWFNGLIPYIAFLLLLYIGGGMLKDSREEEEEAHSSGRLTAGVLVMQGLATSMDALSVGFTMADYTPLEAFLCPCLIGAVTFVICMTGLKIGKGAAKLLRKNALTAGGIILILIGTRILAGHLFL